jgi:hypothetical protein
MASALREALSFFVELGIYDVILPFLLVFTIVFALLEKTKIFGTEEVNGTEYTRKNLNSMVAFVSGILVVMSSRLVAVINETVAHAMLLLLLSVLFLLLAGSFHADEEFFLEGSWQKVFMGIMFVGIILIFLDALGWLQRAYNYVMVYWNSTVLSSVILLAVVIGAMAFVTQGGPQASEE